MLLSGFGMEDAHAVANSLQWGPDGWLYGAQGSTVTAHVRGLEFQQGIWRYHPVTKEFELFAEGGGNTWGLDFDAHGNVIAGTNWGGFAMLHQVQGGYYIKGFGKHGPLHNPHSYGYFDHVPCPNFKGGHVTCGGIVYQGGALPEQYREQLHRRQPPFQLALSGTPSTARDRRSPASRGGDFLTANDTWFRPIDCLTGPDGALYVADWYDKRANHVDPIDTWDRSNGRIYKVQAKGAKPAAGPRPAAGQAVEQGPRRAARRPQQLAGRRGAAHPDGAARRRRSSPACARRCWRTRASWRWNRCGRCTSAAASTRTSPAKLLDHPNEDVRTWAIRLIGDGKKVSPGFRDRLVALARTEKSPTVRCQLACSASGCRGRTACRSSANCCAATRTPTTRSSRCCLWWAIEDKAISDRDADDRPARFAGGVAGADRAAGSSWSGWPGATWTRAARRT